MYFYSLGNRNGSHLLAKVAQSSNMPVKLQTYLHCHVGGLQANLCHMSFFSLSILHIHVAGKRGQHLGKVNVLGVL